MRVITCFLLIGMVLPTAAMCVVGESAVQMPAKRATPVVEQGQDHWWVRVIRYVSRVVIDGVVFETVKTILRKWLDGPPAPVRTPGWGETGCGMGAAGGSRF